MTNLTCRSLRIYVALVMTFVSAFELSAFAGRYTDRPDIVNGIESHPHPEITQVIPHWESIKEGLVESVAQFLGVYKGSELYFLARDGEDLYDVAKYLLTEMKDFEGLKHIHLINVSREHIDNRGHVRGLGEYLSQEGISQKALDQGKKMVFLDSGYRGTIPELIRKQFLPQAKDEQIKSHLLDSLNSSIPSSRVFLYGFDEKMADLHATDVHDEMNGDFEHIPRYFDRSNAYLHEGGKWIPEVPENRAAQDGVVDSKVAKARMQDLRAYLDRGEVAGHFQKRLDFWSKMGTEIRKNNQSGVESLLQKVAESHDPRKNCILQDSYEIATRNFKEHPHAIPRLYTFGTIPAEGDSDLEEKPVWNNEESKVMKDVTNIGYDSLTPFDVKEETAIKLTKSLLSGSLPLRAMSKIRSALGLFYQTNQSEKALPMLLKPLMSEPTSPTQEIRFAAELLAKKNPQDSDSQMALVRGILMATTVPSMRWNAWY